MSSYIFVGRKRYSTSTEGRRRKARAALRAAGLDSAPIIRDSGADPKAGIVCGDRILAQPLFDWE